MTSVRVLLLVVAVLLVVIAYDLVQGWRKRQFLFALKKNINRLRFPIMYIWCMYLLIGATCLVAPIAKWGEVTSLNQTDELAKVFVLLTPTVYIITIVLIAGYICMHAFEPWLGYTKAEQRMLDADKARNLSKLPPILQRIWGVSKTKGGTK